MARNDFTINKQRIIGQIHYRPTLSSFEAVSQAAKLLEDEFADWVAPKPDAITLFTAKDKKSIEITADTITYVKEGPQNDNELTAFIEKIFDKVTKDFDVTEIRRIGFRKTQIFDTPFSFTDIVSLLYKKLYPSSEDFKKISGDKARDVQFVLDSTNKTFLNHVQIGPLKQEEVAAHFQSKFIIKNAKEETVPEQSLFFDVDVALEESLNADNTLEKFKQLMSESKRIEKAYFDYLYS